MRQARADTGSQPELTDGVVVLRPWRDDDLDAARAGHDQEIERWLGSEQVVLSPGELASIGSRWRAGYDDNRSLVGFVVEADGAPVGLVQLRTRDDRTGELSFELYAGGRGHGYATRAVRLLVDYAFEELHLDRVEAYVNTGNVRAHRVATRGGLRREGILRGRDTLFGEPQDTVLLARLATDPPLNDPESFRALLNSFLPRKRAISQMLVRDHRGRVLLCRLTYKKDWDLPGGVVEVHESPQLAVAREVSEELQLDIGAGRLLLTDWMPSWSGWDDALCLVFDGGEHDESLTEKIVAQPREIVSAAFCTLDEVRANCADFTARRIEAALANVDGGGPSYTESGR